MAEAKVRDSPQRKFEFRRIDMPDDREYEDSADADLDAKLVEAIEAARKSGNEQLAGELELQLGSHYYGRELGL